MVAELSFQLAIAETTDMTDMIETIDMIETTDMTDMIDRKLGIASI
nr:hypothetical protein [Nostoc sp. 'Lobaria pulmonaria (5183) cyanobiont']